MCLATPLKSMTGKTSWGWFFFWKSLTRFEGRRRAQVLFVSGFEFLGSKPFESAAYYIFSLNTFFFFWFNALMFRNHFVFHNLENSYNDRVHYQYFFCPWLSKMLKFILLSKMILFWKNIAVQNTLENSKMVLFRWQW